MMKLKSMIGPAWSRAANRTLAAAVAVLLLSACAGLGRSAEERVNARAQQRWDTLTSGEIEQAYQYLSPGYRSGISERNYQRRLLTQQVQWTGAEVIESNCLENTCKVRISVDYKIYGGLPGVNEMGNTRVVEEDWVRADGEWFFLPQN